MARLSLQLMMRHANTYTVGTSKCVKKTALRVGITNYGFFMSRYGSDLTDGPVTPTLMRFASPLLITLCLHTLSGTWNAIWVSHVLGPNELIAVVNANVLLVIMMSMVNGFGMAAGVFVGQAIGAGDIQTAHRVVGTSITFAALGGIALAALGYFGVHVIVDLLLMPEEIRTSLITFFRIVCLSMPTLFLFVFTTMILRSSGDAKTPSIFSTLWIFLGLILTPLLLTGTFGIPQLGIAGAAISGWLANVLALLALLIYVYYRRLPLALRGDNLRYLRPDVSILFNLARRAIPAAAESIIIQGSYFMLLSLVNTYGVLTAAGYSAAAQLWGYVQIPAIAIATSMSAMAAQNIGAGRWDRVGEIAKYGCLLSFSVTTIAALFVYALGEAPLRLFLPSGGESLQIAIEINQVVLWCWPAISITFGLFAVVRANGVMLPSAIIFAITLWGLRVPFANLLQPMLGPAAIWWSFPVGTFTSAVLAYGYYRLGRWRQPAPMRAL